MPRYDIDDVLVVCLQEVFDNGYHKNGVTKKRVIHSLETSEVQGNKFITNKMSEVKKFAQEPPQEDDRYYILRAKEILSTQDTVESKDVGYIAFLCSMFV